MTTSNAVGLLLIATFWSVLFAAGIVYFAFIEHTFTWDAPRDPSFWVTQARIFCVLLLLGFSIFVGDIVYGWYTKKTC